MKNHVGTVLLGAVMVAAASQASAQDGSSDPGKRGGFLAQLDADFGGDNVATVYFEDDSDQDLKAGQGLAISLGGWFRPIESSSFELQASVGYKFSTTAASNADIGMQRMLLQLEGLYRWPNGFFVGGGLMQHMSPSLDGDGFFPSVDFDDATGFNLELGWKWISLHYADVTYSSDEFEDVDASHVGVRLTWRFGQ